LFHHAGSASAFSNQYVIPISLSLEISEENCHLFALTFEGALFEVRIFSARCFGV